MADPKQDMDVTDRGGAHDFHYPDAAATPASAGLTASQTETLTRHGCPVGTLVAQLGKQQQAGAGDVGQVFSELCDWAAGHFAQLGLAPEAARLAGRKMVRDLEGAAMLAHATGDTAHIAEVVSDILLQIDRLAGDHNHD